MVAVGELIVTNRPTQDCCLISQQTIHPKLTGGLNFVLSSLQTDDTKPPPTAREEAKWARTNFHRAYLRLSGETFCGTKHRTRNNFLIKKIPDPDGNQPVEFITFLVGRDVEGTTKLWGGIDWAKYDKFAVIVVRRFFWEVSSLIISRCQTKMNRLSRRRAQHYLPL